MTNEFHCKSTNQFKQDRDDTDLGTFINNDSDEKSGLGLRTSSVRYWCVSFLLEGYSGHLPFFYWITTPACLFY